MLRRKSRPSLAAVIEHLTTKNTDKETCEICQLDHATSTCPLITNKISIADNVAPLKAFSTLPATLECVPLQDDQYKIVAKQRIAPGTQFGPLDAPKSTTNPNPEPEGSSGANFVLKMFRGREFECFLDTSDKGLCNWMVLVRHAPGKCNLICYQLGMEIYFTAVADIAVDEELVVDYSPGYGALIKGGSCDKKGSSSATGLPVLDLAAVLERFQNKKRAFEPEPESDGDVRSKPEPEPIVKKRKLTVDQATETEPEPVPELPTLVTLIDTGTTTDNDVADCVEIETQTEVATYADVAIHADIRSPSPSPAPPSPCLPESPESVVQEIEAEAADDEDGLGEDREDDVLVYEMVLEDADSEPVPQISEQQEDEDGICQRAALSPTSTPKEPATKDIQPEVPPRLQSTTDNDWICKFCGHKFSSTPFYSLHLIEHYKQVGAAKTEKLRKQKETAVADADSEANLSDIESEANTSLGPTPRFPHTCDICMNEKVFNRGEYIIRHLRNHVSGKLGQLEEVILSTATSAPAPTMFACPFCAKALSEVALQSHALICSAVRDYANGTTVNIACPTCVTSFKNLRDFNNHVGRHTHPYICSKCDLRLPTRARLRAHLCAPFHCDNETCKIRPIKKLPQLRTHLEKKHGSSFSSTEIDLYYCYECCLPFSSQTGVDAHTDTAQCGVKVVGALALGMEPPVSGTTSRRKRNAEGHYVCEQCGATYASRNSMKTHRKVHRGKRFKCDHCDKSFHRKDLLIGHEFVHKEPAFVCKHCNKKFKFKKALDLHEKIHSGVKRFSCPICEMTFTQKGNLLTHQKVHLPREERGFQCRVCSKYFSTEDYLRLHVQGHEKRPFSCSICSHTFIKPRLKLRHEREVHGRKGYHFCEYCAHRVKRPHSLLKHLRQYHEDLKEKWSVAGYVKHRYLVNVDGKWKQPDACPTPPTPDVVEDSRVPTPVAFPNSPGQEQELASEPPPPPEPEMEWNAGESSDGDDFESSSESEVSEYSAVVEHEGGPKFDDDLYESEDETDESTSGKTPKSQFRVQPKIPAVRELRSPPPLVPATGRNLEQQQRMILDHQGPEQVPQVQDLVNPQGEQNGIWILGTGGQNGVILEINDNVIGMHDFVTMPFLDVT